MKRGWFIAAVAAVIAAPSLPAAKPEVFEMIDPLQEAAMGFDNLTFIGEPLVIDVHCPPYPWKYARATIDLNDVVHYDRDEEGA